MKYEKLRYQSNKFAQLFMMIGMIFMVLALFRVINVYRFTPIQESPDSRNVIAANIWVGLEILVAIFVMLLSFLAGERFKAYDKKWIPVGIGLTVYPLVKIFMFPLSLNKLLKEKIADGAQIKQNPTTWVIGVIIFLVLSSIFYAISTYIAYTKNKQLDIYYKELNEL